MYEYAAKVINVIDGDTVDMICDVGYRMTTVQRYRLLGVNCPELHGPTRAAGLAAKAYTEAALLGRDVRIRTAKSDSFGRWLARIYIGDWDFNKSLIAAGHAVPFMTSGQQLEDAPAVQVVPVPAPPMPAPTDGGEPATVATRPGLATNDGGGIDGP